MKRAILLTLALLLSLSAVNVDAQTRGKQNHSQAVQAQKTFRVYAILKLISKGRMALDFGQKSENGYFYGQISDILLDDSGNDYKIGSDHDWIALLNKLSKLGWHHTGGMGTSVGGKIWESCPVLYKDVHNEAEIIEGLTFKKP